MLHSKNVTIKMSHHAKVSLCKKVAVKNLHCAKVTLSANVSPCAKVTPCKCV